MLPPAYLEAGGVGWSVVLPLVLVVVASAETSVWGGGRGGVEGSSSISSNSPSAPVEPTTLSEGCSAVVARA